MPCYAPLQAYQCASGEIVFVERRRFDVVRSLQLPCGQCVGCRLERSRQWAMRCVHEASLHESSCFVTLTYDAAHLPADGSLNYDHFQRFMKRLRKRFAPIRVRFYMCGEYGEINFRPHYHACLFGFDFPDKKAFKVTDSGSKLYTSALLESLWPFGLSSVGDVTFESAAYVARYCMKKVTGRDAKRHYERVLENGEIVNLKPEFNKMSLKPGIGAEWYRKWKRDVYPHDYVVVNGKECKPPKYYDGLYEREFPDEFEDLKARRELDGLALREDNTPERLAVKAVVAEARLKSLKRCLS